jgi:hypothetical protein
MIHERFYNVYILGGKCAPYMVSTWHVAPCYGYMAIHKFGFFADVRLPTNDKGKQDNNDLILLSKEMFIRLQTDVMPEQEYYDLEQKVA